MNKTTKTAVVSVIEFPMEGELSPPGMIFAPWVESFLTTDLAKKAIVTHIADVIRKTQDLGLIAQFARGGLHWYPINEGTSAVSKSILEAVPRTAVYGLCAETGMTYVITETKMEVELDG